MRIENELRLSFYQELTDIDERHTVKLVQHIENRRIFVLKTLKIYDLQVFRSLASHPVPGMPHIEELIEGDHTLYVVEEYISGSSLRNRIDKTGVVGEAEATALICQLCNILRPLHRMNPPIVHRDIKPENLMITPDNQVVLVDFNSAKESNESQTQDTVLIGTVGYAAPEQYGFSSSQPTADIYAIGVLLNEMLTGHLPNEQIYSGKLEPVIRKCLQMDPANRYQSVDDILRVMTTNKDPWGIRWAKVREWLPPGLRNKNPGIALPSLLWYFFITTLSFSLEVKDTYGSELLLNRVVCWMIFLLETLWFGNYRKIWSLMPLTRSKYLAIRVLGVAIWSVAWLFGPVFLFVILSGLIYR